jgi:zinc protease
MKQPKFKMPVLIFLFITFTSLIFSLTKVEDIRTFTLKNGMKFIILEDHSIPNANTYIFYKVGSRNEYPGITGLSHFFEHMMFNGAKKYGPKMFDIVMEGAGGANNAYTSENVTVYTNFFPSSALEVIFDLEADRIGHLALDDKMVESERGVVLSEYTTWHENSNYGLLEEQVRAAAFMAHPYRWMVLGYESDIRNWKKSDLQRYFDTYYAPNNALAIIVGDVNVEDVKKLVHRYFDSIPSREPPRPVHTREPEQMGEKRLYVGKDVSSPHLMIVYHVPETGSADYYALDMLESILGTGRSSRLYNSLVNEKQLAVRISAYMSTDLDPTLFSIYAICAGGVDENSVEQAIYEEIDKVINEGVSENELQKVKNRKLVNFYRAMETIDGRADTIGTYEIYFGSYEKLFQAPEEYKKVTTDDIKRVAKKYFKKSNRTVGILKKSEEK